MSLKKKCHKLLSQTPKNNFFREVFCNVLSLSIDIELYDILFLTYSIDLISGTTDLASL